MLSCFTRGLRRIAKLMQALGLLPHLGRLKTDRWLGIDGEDLARSD